MQRTLAGLVHRIQQALARREGVVDADAVARLQAVLAADYGTTSGPEDDVLGDVAAIFDLGELDVLLLTVALAPELDATFGGAYALLQQDPTRQRPSVGLALELAGAASLDPAARERLSSTAPLRANDLLDVSGEAPLLARSLRVPDRVVAHLAGEERLDPIVEAMLLSPVPLRLPESEQLAAALNSGRPLAWLTASPGSAGVGVAAGAFDVLDAAVVAVDVRRRPAGVSVGDAVRVAVREAGLLLSGLVIADADLVVEDGGPALLRRLERSPVPVVAVSAERWNPDWLLTVPYLMDAPVPKSELRAQLWEQQLAGGVDSDSDEWRALVALRLTPEQIVRAARHAAADETKDVNAVREAARFVGSSGLKGASRERPHQTFADLILPTAAMEPVREIVRWATHRDAVLGQGPVAGKHGHGRGITALFAGSPGTGKTLAAHVIAGELGLDLQTVDLSAVVDKYIGETEKRLEQLLAAAENLNAVLLFDEADALFGSRTDVKDARDRYANQEVAYLLQRIERFDGIAILTTNQRGNIDAAFSRRLNFVVTFPDPDVPTRIDLWRGHLSALSATSSNDPVDVPCLAERFDLAGGDIRNIVLAAAYAAADEGTAVGMRHVHAAAQREYRKLGRMTQGVVRSVSEAR
ncbi:MAG TPA: ATP-binding protein [Jatrophihabitans sp.]|jgi:predicted nucleic acid-binding protein